MNVSFLPRMVDESGQTTRPALLCLSLLLKKKENGSLMESEVSLTQQMTFKHEFGHLFEKIKSALRNLFNAADYLPASIVEIPSVTLEKDPHYAGSVNKDANAGKVLQLVKSHNYSPGFYFTHVIGMSLFDSLINNSHQKWTANDLNQLMQILNSAK